jgi:CspA family cold shock protein
MNFRDHWAENRKGERFIFTVEMQRRLSEAGLPVEPDALEQLPSSSPAGGRSSEQRSYESRSYEPRSYEPRSQQQPVEREQRSTAREYRPGERESASVPREEAETQPEIAGPETVQIDPMTGKYIGRVKWYNAKKGYGFILRGGAEEIFFHRSSAVGDPLEFLEGQWVLYDVEDTDKGPEASDVEPYEES